MKCERSEYQLTYWIGRRLEEAEREAYVTHLRECSICRNEARAFEYIWDALEDIPVPEPSEAMQVKFLTMLDEFRETATKQVEEAMPQKGKLIRLWASRPIGKIAAAVVLLLVGVGLGYRWERSPVAVAGEGYAQQIDSLSSQVHEMRKMMMLSLLENPSASERIRGVSYSSEIKRPGGPIADALLATLNNDPNVNVRLATLDALSHYVGEPVVREGLVHSIVEQDSPLVQSALADLMLKLQEKRAVPSFRKLLQQKGLNLLVRDKLERTINRLI